MLGVDGSAEAEFDSRTECLDVGKRGDAVVVDLALQYVSPRFSKRRENTLTKVSLSRRYLAATSRATPPEVALGSKLAFPAAYHQHSPSKSLGIREGTSKRGVTR